MAEANGEAAAPETARQPCGIVGCCRAEPSGYTPTAAPKVRLTEEQRAEYSSAALEEFDSGCRERDRVTCWEEVGHTILAAINHATINLVQACVTSTSHLSYSCRNSEDVDLPILIGGRVARGMAEQRILAPSAGEMTTYLQKARSDSDGSCDWCQCARKLLKYNPDADDAALVERWRDHWRHVVELLDTAVARATLDHLASALQERHHLTGDEVREIIGDAWDTVVWAFVFNKHCK
jgi:hypothetical protein